jgi:hypothetical protein
LVDADKDRAASEALGQTDKDIGDYYTVFVKAQPLRPLASPQNLANSLMALEMLRAGRYA